jgi:hypothetical protein
MMVRMRLTDSQREQLQFAGEELADLLRLVQQVFRQNARGIGSAGLNSIGRLTESIVETQKNLKQFRKTNENTHH